jgi:cellulose synthase/poly-beta-1,6-N-acetylglucosamine synthase-like glycosyltransferase
MVLFTTTHNYAILYLAFVALIVVYLGASYFIGIFSRPFDLLRHVAITDEHLTFRPTVDVYLPCCGEPIEVLANAYAHVRRLDYPAHLLRIFVLDDRGDKRVRMWAEHFEFEYLSRPDRGELKKAGNLRYAFAHTEGEFILVLDADFCPRSDFLSETLPYFAYDERIAIVQTPQYFTIEPGQAWVEKGSAYIQELFYRLIQVNRDTWDAAICVGTCALYRRTALAPHGGTYPIAYSEDLHTGWQASVDGWKVRYLPLCLAKGICPDTMSSFYVQQMRWCQGSTSLLLSRKFWSTPLGHMQRLCYVSGMFYYVATAASVFLTPIPALAVVWLWPEHVFWYNYLFSLPSLLFGTVVMALWGRAPFGWYVLSARQVSYYAHLLALWSKVQGSAMPWLPTGDNAATKSAAQYVQFKHLCFAWITLSSGLSAAGAFYHMRSLTDYNFYPLLFFAGLNYFVAMKVFRDEA